MGQNASYFLSFDCVADNSFAYFDGFYDNHSFFVELTYLTKENSEFKFEVEFFAASPTPLQTLSA